jgi:hypothetical protein
MAASVADKSSAVTQMEQDWDLARALLGGTRAMRAEGVRYLPKWPNEDQNGYDTRLQTATLFPAYRRTVESLTGKPFSKPVTLGEDVPQQLQDWCQDVDLEGRNLHTFAADVFESGLGYGICGILVDYPTGEQVPTTAAGVRTLAAEQAAGLRPYMVHIKPEQVLGWRAARRNGKWVLLQLRIMECVSEADGDYGTNEVEQVRVLEPGKWQTYRQQLDKTWLLHAEGMTTLKVVPFVPVYGRRTGFMTGTPPLLNLAFMNVKHWQSQSDQDTILHVARVPILVASGVEDTTGITVGASAAVKLPQGATLTFCEHSGKAIDAGKVSLDTLKEEMRNAGAELLVLIPRITATEVASEDSKGLSDLQRMTQDLEDSLDQALQLMADWVNLGEGGHCTVYKDFGALALTDASAQILMQSAQAGIISHETYFEEMQRRGSISPDLSWVDEQARLDSQGPSLGMMGGQGGQGGGGPGTGNPAGG